jgi:hypothetical protein
MERQGRAAVGLNGGPARSRRTGAVDIGLLIQREELGPTAPVGVF